MTDMTIFLNNIVKIREGTGKNQEEFFDYYEVTKYISNNPKSQQGKADLMSKLETGTKDFPAVLLPLYAKIGKCSIDDLFRSEIKKRNDTAPPIKIYREYDICKMIVDLSRQQGKPLSLTCAPVKVKYKETYFEPIFDENGFPDFCQKKIVNDYYAFIFPNYEKCTSEEEVEEFRHVGNDDEPNQSINKFLDGFFKFKSMEQKGLLQKKDCDEGIDKLLSAVKKRPLSTGVYHANEGMTIDNTDFPTDCRALVGSSGTETMKIINNLVSS